MTAPALTVEAWTPRPHPLATRRGIELLDLMIQAGQRWKPLTAVQRKVLVDAVHGVLAGLPDGGEVPEVRLGDGVKPATVRALSRRGLATPDRQVTPLGVQVTSLAVPVRRQAVAR